MCLQGKSRREHGRRPAGAGNGSGQRQEVPSGRPVRVSGPPLVGSPGPHTEPSDPAPTAPRPASALSIAVTVHSRRNSTVVGVKTQVGPQTGLSPGGGEVDNRCLWTATGSGLREGHLRSGSGSPGGMTSCPVLPGRVHAGNIKVHTHQWLTSLKAMLDTFWIVLSLCFPLGHLAKPLASCPPPRAPAPRVWIGRCGFHTEDCRA